MNLCLKSLLIVLSLLLSGCGNDGVRNEGVIAQADLDLTCEVYNLRFDDCEIDSLYSDETKFKNGKAVPVSRDPQTYFWKFSDAPDNVKNEWKFGEYVSVFKGYLNIGENVGNDQLGQLISFFEKISDFKEIRSSDGKKIFNNTFNSSPKWERIPDQVDGAIVDSGDYFKLVLELVAKGVSVQVKSGMILTIDDDKFSVYMRNEKQVKTFLTGVILNKDGMRLKWEFYPYRNGYLVWGASVISPKKFEEDIKNVFSQEFSKSVFSWFTNLNQ